MLKIDKHYCFYIVVILLLISTVVYRCSKKDDEFYTYFVGFRQKTDVKIPGFFISEDSVYEYKYYYRFLSVPIEDTVRSIRFFHAIDSIIAKESNLEMTSPIPVKINKRFIGKHNLFEVNDFKPIK